MELEKLKEELPSLTVVGQLEDCCAEKEVLQKELWELRNKHGDL